MKKNIVVPINGPGCCTTKKTLAKITRENIESKGVDEIGKD